MWLGEQHKRPVPSGEGQTGVVVMAGDQLAVRLDSELRDPFICAPAGYRWTPSVGDRVLVIRGEGERPCVVGVCGGSVPPSAELRALSLNLAGAVSINGVPLETYIRQVMEESS